MSLDFTDKVVIVTGAGGGLGKSHALDFARRGAKVVVNDLGGSMDGSGGSSEAAEAVVAEIKAAGGEAIANGSSVTDDAGVDNMIAQTMDALWPALMCWSIMPVCCAIKVSPKWKSVTSPLWSMCTCSAQ
jgi:NAD(P)-dependent dehydrogenase (short-subunit alcohol dehydrogenase family)